jgi:hypothetical protein
MPRADRTAIAVGQVRLDPDPRYATERRGCPRTVRVVEVVERANMFGRPPGMHALVEDETTRRRGWVAVERLERWAVENDGAVTHGEGR